MKVKIVKDPQEGVDYLKKLLYSVVDNKTVLFLSGGKTPKDTYLELAKEGKINPGAVAMVDERVGFKNHSNSNERMIGETGLLSYFEKKKIPFYPILGAKDYGKKVKYLLEHFSKSVGILGIGEDGHVASLPASPKLQRGEPAGISNFQFPISNKEDLVMAIGNFPGELKERITLTFQALAQMDLLIVLVLGENKKLALQKMFDPTERSGQASLSEIPARFFLREDISPKTILITDQKI